MQKNWVEYTPGVGGSDLCATFVQQTSPGLLVPPGSSIYEAHSPGWYGLTLSFLWAFLCVLHVPPTQGRRVAPGLLLNE